MIPCTLCLRRACAAWTLSRWPVAADTPSCCHVRSMFCCILDGSAALGCVGGEMLASGRSCVHVGPWRRRQIRYGGSCMRQRVFTQVRVFLPAGHGDQGWKYIPKPVLSLASVNVRYIACGSYHTAAISGVHLLLHDRSIMLSRCVSPGSRSGGRIVHVGRRHVWQAWPRHGNGTTAPIAGSVVAWHARCTSHMRQPAHHRAPGCVNDGFPSRCFASQPCTRSLPAESGAVYSWGDRENGVCGHGDMEGAHDVCLVCEICDGN